MNKRTQQDVRDGIRKYVNQALKLAMLLDKAIIVVPIPGQSPSFHFVPEDKLELLKLSMAGGTGYALNKAQIKQEYYRLNPYLERDEPAPRAMIDELIKKLGL